MKLENRFTVPVPRSQAWQVLLDVERIAPCMPGAKLLSRDGDSFTGQVKVKLGPINLTYGGQAEFVDLDEGAGLAVIAASGKETRGTGTAKATITCRLVDRGASTDIEVDTDLAITGKPAQFGRGVLADVSAKLVDQFAACLAEEIQEGTPTEAAGQVTGAAGQGTSGGMPDTSAAADSTADRPAPQSPAAQSPTATRDLQAGTTPDEPAVDKPADVPYGPPPTSGLEIALAEDFAHPHGQEQAEPVPEGVLAPREATGEQNAPRDSGYGDSASGDSASASPRRRQQTEAIDLLGTAGEPVLKRIAPLAAGVLLLVVVVRRLLR